MRDQLANYIQTSISDLECNNMTNFGDCYFPGECQPDKIPDLNFTFKFEGSNATFSIPLGNLLQYHKRTNECVLEIATMGDIKENTFRIGEPFFRSFYVIFDNENKTIGLGLSAISPEGSLILNPPKPDPPAPIEPTYKPRIVWNLWTKLLIALLLILIGLILALLCYMRHLKKVNEEERNA